MKTNYQDDQRLLKKARWKVILSMVMAFILLCVYFFGVNWLLTLPFFERPEHYDLDFAVSALVQTVYWLAVFFFMESSHRLSRTFYHLGVWLEVFLSCWIAWNVYASATGKLTYVAWFLVSLIKVYCFYSYGHWLKTSYWCKIFFDKTLVVYDEPEKSYQEEESTPAYSSVRARGNSEHSAPSLPRNSAASSVKEMREQRPETEPVYSASQRVPDFASAYQTRTLPGAKKLEPAAEEKEMTYPQLAIRLALCVYGGLFIFPVICELLKFLFFSTDYKYNFATTDMFTLCIISAVLWTFVVFLLYLKMPQSKTAVKICLGIEVLVTIWYASRLWYYYTNPEFFYKWYTFAAFITLDLIRYFILVWTISPVFSLPVPEKADSLFETGDRTDGDSLRDLIPDLGRQTKAWFKEKAEMIHEDLQEKLHHQPDLEEISSDTPVSSAQPSVNRPAANFEPVTPKPASAEMAPIKEEHPEQFEKETEAEHQAELQADERPAVPNSLSAPAKSRKTGLDILPLRTGQNSSGISEKATEKPEEPESDLKDFHSPNSFHAKGMPSASLASRKNLPENEPEENPDEKIERQGDDEPIVLVFEEEMPEFGHDETESSENR